MARKISLKRQLLPINLVDWVRLYDTAYRGNYAIEFLTAATYDTLDIPNAERYQLPPDVEDKDLDETIEELVLSTERNEKKAKEKIRTRKKSVKTGWKQGKKPWAIKCLDELRGVENPEFRIDLLRPGLYNGTVSIGNSIPFAVNILPGLVYLYTSVLISGSSSEVNKHLQHSNPKGNGIIIPSSRLPRKSLEAKVKEIYTKNRGRRNEVNLKQPYANLLQLLGMPYQGKLSRKTYEKLGLGFIEKLATWVEKGRLSRRDNAHAKKALYRFVEAFVDHRYCKHIQRIHRRGKKYEIEIAQFYMPGFRRKKTRNQFKDLFLRVWNIVNPEICLRVYPIKNKKTYHSMFYVRKEDRDRLEARFPKSKAA